MRSLRRADCHASEYLAQVSLQTDARKHDGARYSSLTKSKHNSFDLERKRQEADMEPVRICAAAEWSARALTRFAMTG